MVRCTLRLITRGAASPIIILQGDHGTGFLGFPEEPTAADVSAAQLRERFAPFGACYLPGGGGTTVERGVTLVNLLPLIINHYFGAELALQPDDLFVSVDRAPFKFRRVELPGSGRVSGEVDGRRNALSR